MHWVPVLNHFDAFFETHVAPSSEDGSARGGEEAKKLFPAEPTRWIVRASCVILENCANKHVYSSGEHLGALLSCDDAEVALDALRLLAVATRRARMNLPDWLRSYPTTGWIRTTRWLGDLGCGNVCSPLKVLETVRALRLALLTR